MKQWFYGTSAVLLLSVGSAVAAEERSDANASCRQETKRVVVWAHGPKASAMTRLESREVTVCDAKASPPSARESSKS
jgi:4-hydroxy-3-methylbut-2-enyl diphosphate reductase IspH